jgi:hypothetical protein
MDFMVEDTIIQNEMMIEEQKVKRHNDIMIYKNSNFIRNNQEILIEKKIHACKDDNLSDNSENKVSNPEPEPEVLELSYQNNNSRSELDSKNKKKISIPLRTPSLQQPVNSSGCCCIIL